MRNELQLQNLAWTSTSESWPMCSKSEQKFNFMTKPQLPNLQQTVANTILIINISNSNNLNKFWVGIFTRKFTKRYGVSQLVSQLVS